MKSVIYFHVFQKKSTKLNYFYNTFKKAYLGSWGNLKPTIVAVCSTVFSPAPL